MAEPKEYIWGTGRRKSAVARVRLSRGSGTITVNHRPFEKYFLTEDDRQNALAALNATKAFGRYDILVNASGGGIGGQAGAMKLGIARALKKIEPALESVLRAQGLLTRDPRMKERKKYGLRGARRGVQYSKR
ncbi:MAG TPA: 30S ribosomal protein S9 [Planctomycetota bacterium]|nr:30S ribosomal protein S9 [Planctomycetota bacterium]